MYTLFETEMKLLYFSTQNISMAWNYILGYTSDCLSVVFFGKLNQPLQTRWKGIVFIASSECSHFHIKNGIVLFKHKSPVIYT